MAESGVLVTGAGGFLGSHICRYFGERGHPIAALGRFAASESVEETYPNLHLLAGMTLPDPAFVKAVRHFNPGLVVHCAGTASVADSVERPHSDFQRTVEVCAFVLDTLRQNAPACKFILLSSAAVYGNPSSLPIDESMPCAPISPYGYHKWMCELLAEEYRLLFGLQTASLRIFSAYGERLQRLVIHDICRKISDSTCNEVEVYGTGEESRDFIHASDVAQAVAYVAKSNDHSVFNVASGAQTSIRELVETLVACLDSDKRIRFTGTNRPGYPNNWEANIARMRSTGFTPRVPLNDGLSDYCRWYTSRLVPTL